MIFIFRIGPVIGGSLMMIFVGLEIFGRAEHDNLVGVQVMAAMVMALGAWILFSLLRHMWRAMRAFFR
jgi:hypothetical protein